MRTITLLKNNDKALLMKLYNAKNEEIDLSTFSFQQVILRGRLYNSLSPNGDFPLEMVGELYTDEATETWIKFQFMSEQYEELELTQYICEVIIELLPERFINAFIEKGSDHRFIIDIKDTFI